MTIRRPTAQDLPALARLWHETWHDTHGEILPPERTQKMTHQHFADRLTKECDRVRMIGSAETPDGFCLINDDEIDAIFVAPKSRGTNIAQLLMSDGEARLKASGIKNGHLICLAQNERAARFYEKEGWAQIGEISDPVETKSGVIAIQCRVFRKIL